MSEYGAGTSIDCAVGVVSGVVGVAEGAGEAVGKDSTEEQPEEIKGRIMKRRMIDCLLNIVNPFNGFDHVPNCGENFTPPNGLHSPRVLTVVHILVGETRRA